MKIAIIGTTVNSILGFREGLIKALIQKKMDVYALAVDYTVATEKQVELLGATPVSYHLSRSGLNPISNIKSTYQLSKILKSLGVDIVFSYFAKPVIFATFAARLAGVKRKVGMLEGLGYVFTDQPYGLSFKVALLRKVQVLLYRFAIPLLDEIIFLNQDDPRDLLYKHSIKFNNISILGGIGLDLKKYLFSYPVLNPIRFIFIGRLLIEKGVNEYIDAAKHVKSIYPLTEFVILGEVDTENPGSLDQKKLNSYKEEGLLVHPGHVPNVIDWIKQSTVFVLPSYREGLPRSSQEAMAIGRPVITTDVPGCRDTVIDGENGFIIPPWRADRLAEKMIWFIKHPEKLASMGRRSREIAEKKYDEIAINKKLIAIIEGTCA